MKLAGNIDNNENITLNEFNYNGNIIGNFKGQLSGKNFKGIWSKPDGINNMPFLLIDKYSNDCVLIFLQTKSPI